MTQQKKKERSPIGRFFTSRLFLIVGFIVAVLVAFSYARAYYQDYAIRQEISRLEGEVRRLEHKKLESFELLKYVSSGAYVEEKGRVEFNLKKPGENVMLIAEEGMMKHEEMPLVREEKSSTLKNPIKWWYYFIHKDISNT
jgi:cell division protein FtsB